MNRADRAVLLLFVLVFLPACPFESSVPVAEPGAPIDPDLLGVWIAGSEDGESVSLLRFLALDGQEYVVDFLDYPKGDSGVVRVYIVVVGGQRFLQVRDLASGDDGRWMLASYLVDEDGLMKVRLLDGEAFPRDAADDAGRMRAFIEAHLDDELLHGDQKEIVLVRPDRIGQLGNRVPVVR